MTLRRIMQLGGRKVRKYILIPAVSDFLLLLSVVILIVFFDYPAIIKILGGLIILFMQNIIILLIQKVIHLFRAKEKG